MKSWISTPVQNFTVKFYTWISYTAWRVSKYGVISGPYFPVLGLNTAKYGLEITPYLDNFHALNNYIHWELWKQPLRGVPEGDYSVSFRCLHWRVTLTGCFWNIIINWSTSVSIWRCVNVNCLRVMIFFNNGWTSMLHWPRVYLIYENVSGANLGNDRVSEMELLVEIVSCLRKIGNLECVSGFQVRICVIMAW